MNCSVCGAQIPMGQPNCPNCGNMVQQPVQPMGGYQQPVQPMGGYQQPVQPMGGYQQPVQPMGGHQQPVQPMGGYQQPQQPAQPMGGYQQPVGGGVNANAIVNAVKGDVMKLIGLIGAFLIAISPFFTWLSYKIEWLGSKESDSANLFGLAGGDTSDGIFVLWGIILVLAGLLIMMLDLADYVPQFMPVKQRLSAIPYIELIIVGVALLAVILSLANGTVNDFIKESEQAAEMFGIEDNLDIGRGLGPVLAILGVLAAGAPKVLNILGIKIGK